ncbi:DUF3048 domain-containing protein [Ilumatobacter coccineus]|uniref:DUF3048 domain-containing protein n=1 Tax=Ilumatobacter coccineus (strain NBRC 103263 / KCTC 29153 / YM16-304) TaxID=1313172 RepID=A0A6C7EAZ1_ILUCY|nr:DUF3048 domain-containing protein [Ilumatobacter coccineus]BAN02295.1 hypothetical protein YM304_19810 [Ilumatobacter coccineus YM16-304]
MNTSRSNASRLAAGLTGLALVAAACGGGGDSAEETTTVPEETTTTTTEVVETTTTVEAATTTTTEPAVDEPLRQPLTGEIVDSEDELITRPALAVKIDNADGARRNHTGLAVADIVFEEIVEDSNTRFAAVFHTQDADPIGPIRSGRSQDVDILSSLNSPLFAWSGGNPGVTRLIRDSFLTDLNWQRNAGSYQRGPGTSPSNLYSDTEQLYALTPEDHPGAPPIQWSYVPDNAAFAGDDVSGFDLAMRRRDISWDWNAELDKFVRSMDGTPHDDVTYGPIAATNVVVMLTEYRPSTIDRNSPEAQTIGEGLVYVFSNGGYIEGKWSRGLAVGPITFNDLEGNPIPLTPGNTWIELAELIDDAGEGESPVDMVIRPA